MLFDIRRFETVAGRKGLIGFRDRIVRKPGTHEAGLGGKDRHDLHRPSCADNVIDPALRIGIDVDIGRPVGVQEDAVGIRDQLLHLSGVRPAEVDFIQDAVNGSHGIDPGVLPSGERESPGGVGSESVRRQLNRAVVTGDTGGEPEFEFEIENIESLDGVGPSSIVGDDVIAKEVRCFTGSADLLDAVNILRLGNESGELRLLGSRPVQQVQVVQGDVIEAVHLAVIEDLVFLHRIAEPGIDEVDVETFDIRDLCGGGCGEEHCQQSR